MSEFIEIQEVAVRRDVDGNSIIKDQGKYCINKDQIVSVSKSPRAEGCVSIILAIGKVVLVRGTSESITGLKPPAPPVVEKPKAKPKAKSKHKSKHGYWD